MIRHSNFIWGTKKPRSHFCTSFSRWIAVTFFSSRKLRCDRWKFQVWVHHLNLIMSETWIFERQCGAHTAGFGGTERLLQCYYAVAVIVILLCKLTHAILLENLSQYPVSFHDHILAHQWGQICLRDRLGYFLLCIEDGIANSTNNTVSCLLLTHQPNCLNPNSQSLWYFLSFNL